MKNGEIISLEQLYKMLHISKRKAAWMLQNDIIPCEVRNTSTYKYSIRKADVLAYLEKNDQEKRREIPVGIFSTKKANNPHSSEPQDSEHEGCFDYINLKLRGKERTMFKQMLEEQLQDVSDVLTIDEGASLMGYNTKTILRYIQKQYFYAVIILCQELSTMQPVTGGNHMLGLVNVHGGE